MTTPNHDKIRVLTLDLGGTNFEVQCRKAQIVNNTGDPEIFYTLGDDGDGDSISFSEAADPAYALDLGFYSDWRSAGITDWLWDHDGEVVTFQLDLYPTIPTKHVIFSGSVQVKAPSAGGEVRAQDVTDVTLACQGKPDKARP
jgi:hypothetical protein